MSMDLNSLNGIPSQKPLTEKLEVTATHHVALATPAEPTEAQIVEARTFVENVGKDFVRVLLNDASDEEIILVCKLMVEIVCLRTGALPSLVDPGQPNNGKQLKPALEVVFGHASDLQAMAPAVMRSVDLPHWQRLEKRRQFALALRDVFLRLTDGADALSNQLAQGLSGGARALYGSLVSLLDNDKPLARELGPLKDLVLAPSEKAAETKKNNEKVAGESYQLGIQVGRQQMRDELTKNPPPAAAPPPIVAAEEPVLSPPRPPRSGGTSGRRSKGR